LALFAPETLIRAARISHGDEKRAYIEHLGAGRCAAVGGEGAVLDARDLLLNPIALASTLRSSGTYRCGPARIAARRAPADAVSGWRPTSHQVAPAAA
jgi:hypothetical protein